MKQMRNAVLIRKEKNLSIEDVVRKVDVSGGQLSRFERGEVGFGLEKLEALAGFYECTIDDLVRVVEPDSEPTSEGAA